MSPAVKGFDANVNRYGLEFPKEVGIADHVPLKESCPRIPEPYASKIFYYTQYDLLEHLSKGKSWTFSEVRPDGVVGFAPGINAMNMAQGIAIYLSMFKEVHGAGSTVPFPGHDHGYHSTHTDTFQDILAQMEIHAALNTDKCGSGGVFNVADGQVVTVNPSASWVGLPKRTQSPCLALWRSTRMSGLLLPRDMV
jgi:hypothetical protein